jgi:hypothetical protein
VLPSLLGSDTPPSQGRRRASVRNLIADSKLCGRRCADEGSSASGKAQGCHAILSIMTYATTRRPHLRPPLTAIRPTHERMRLYRFGPSTEGRCLEHCVTTTPKSAKRRLAPPAPASESSTSLFARRGEAERDRVVCTYRVDSKHECSLARLPKAPRFRT